MGDRHKVARIKRTLGRGQGARGSTVNVVQEEGRVWQGLPEKVTFEKKTCE